VRRPLAEQVLGSRFEGESRIDADMMIVFQSIEITRLADLLKLARSSLKEFQNKQFNVSNYEVQIRELTERYTYLEGEYALLLQDKERLGSACQQLYDSLNDHKQRLAQAEGQGKAQLEEERARASRLEKDIEQWRRRYASFEVAKSKELDDMRLAMESQRKSMVDR
jgi:hypothetical protein